MTEPNLPVVTTIWLVDVVTCDGNEAWIEAYGRGRLHVVLQLLTSTEGDELMWTPRQAEPQTVVVALDVTATRSPPEYHHLMIQLLHFLMRWSLDGAVHHGPSVRPPYH